LCARTAALTVETRLAEYERRPCGTLFRNSACLLAAANTRLSEHSTFRGELAL